MKAGMFLSIIFGMLCAWGGENIAIVKKVQGNVFVKHNDTYKLVEKGSFLQEGSILQTGDYSSAGLAFNDGTLVSLGPKSVFAVTRYRFKPGLGDYAFDMNLRQGSAAVETGKIGKLSPKDVSFKVPQGYIGIRGTRFIVDVKE